ncbi:sensor histidine kinase [Spirosoma sp. HMF4905]|uniref:Sensor histidine kinase n=1 Tax=Spirosoma arboris TaxID=2682092 RepID=A0A7K1SBA5_9BACT|nr:histidine kinase [Spirosoma arboris]MVM31104.1 sensor histidine kinase [Spirosoma arboris]
MKNQLSLYWKCQLTGWSLAALYWGYIGITGGRFNIALGIFQFVTDVAVYSLITHLYRNFALRHHWTDLEINPLLKRLIPAVFVLGLVYVVVTLAKIFLFRLWFTVGPQQDFFPFIRLNGVTIFIAGVRLMSIWLLAYHLYHYAQREVKSTKEKARQEIITRDARLSNLSAQLNPHLLFNSLNTIKALVLDEPETARHAIDLLSDLLRTGLYTGDDVLISVKDELELVIYYLDLEKLRFEERLTYQLDLDDSLASVQVLRLSIQTLVENALKHGISTRKAGGLVRIKISKEGEFIRIMVQNPGCLDSRIPVTGVGLANLAERLQLKFNGKASLRLVNEPEAVVSAIVQIPIS